MQLENEPCFFKVIVFSMLSFIFITDNSFANIESFYLHGNSGIHSPSPFNESIFSVNQGFADKSDALEEFIRKYPNFKAPFIEYKKINATKYYVNFYNIRSGYAFIFSEKFHNGWKVYPKTTGNNLSEVKFNPGLESNRFFNSAQYNSATPKEILRLSKHGWISKSKNINQSMSSDHYISKNENEYSPLNTAPSLQYISNMLSGTIQNENLVSAPFYETWGKKHLPEKFHVQANGYANAWLMDLDYLIFHFPNSLLINKDDSYQLKLILEFSPQKSLYFSIIVSAVVFSIALLYFVYFLVVSFKRL